MGRRNESVPFRCHRALQIDNLVQDVVINQRLDYILGRNDELFVGLHGACALKLALKNNVFVRVSFVRKQFDLQLLIELFVDKFCVLDVAIQKDLGCGSHVVLDCLQGRF
jgi:hypothetical protein